MSYVVLTTWALTLAPDRITSKISSLNLSHTCAIPLYKALETLMKNALNHHFVGSNILPIDIRRRCKIEHVIGGTLEAVNTLGASPKF